MVVLVQEHWPQNVTVKEAHVTRRSDLADSSRTILERAKAPAELIRDWLDLNCLQSKSQAFQMSAHKSCSYCEDDTFRFALRIMWVFKGFAPFEQ